MIRTLLCLVAAAGFAAPALAYDDGYGYPVRDEGYGASYGDGGNVHYAYGEVLQAEPIYRTSHYPADQEVCREQPVEYYQAGRPSSPAGTIVGAIIGGVIGHRIGHHGRRGHYRGHHSGAGTVAGAAVGAAIGYNASRDRGHVSRGYEQRCYTERGYETAEEIVGYDVTYRYRGEIYQTRTEQYPGDTIRVRVAVDPVR